MNGRSYNRGRNCECFEPLSQKQSKTVVETFLSHSTQQLNCLFLSSFYSATKGQRTVFIAVEKSNDADFLRFQI